MMPILEQLEADEEIEIPRIPSPTLGHAAAIASRNERARKKAKSRRRVVRSSGSWTASGRLHSWKEPGWDIFTVEEEGEE